MKLTSLAVVFTAIMSLTSLASCSLMNPEPSSRSEAANLPALPVLPTAIELEHNGVRGVWMSEGDVANLMIWIHYATNAIK